MFCSNCGKTIRPEDDVCRHCGASLGESRFYGNTYTSSQVRLPAEALSDAPAGGMISYTRTNYMSYDNQPEDDVYSNTTYRPLLRDEEDLSRMEESIPADEFPPEDEFAEETEPEAESAVEETETAAPVMEEPVVSESKSAEDVQAEIPDESSEDFPEESISPLPELERPAISPRVLGYMEELENREQRRANSKLNNLRVPSFLNKMKKDSPAEEEELPEAEDIAAEYQIENDEAEGWENSESTGESSAESNAGEYVAEEGEDAFSVYEDPDYAEYEEKKSGFDLARLFPNVDFKALLQNRILHISAAVVLIVAVIVAGSIWLKFVTAKRAKIADVTYTVYSQGIELLTAHTTQEYRDEMVNTYIVNTSYANTAFDEQMQAINALIPEAPLENDELFVTTLTNIQNAITEAIKADANAELNGTSADRTADSERDWKAIDDAINKLSETVNAGELLSIVSNLESIVAPTPSPSPTPAGPKYETLQNGMMDSTPVQQMQNRLINLGFLDGDADGDFGNGTEAAVKAFQRAAGLPDDGIATAAVQEAMYAEDAPRVNSTPETTDAPDEDSEADEDSEPVG